jgi:ATP-dependent DNA helicase RecQ
LPLNAFGEDSDSPAGCQSHSTSIWPGTQGTLIVSFPMLNPSNAPTRAVSATDLQRALKRHFGYEEFRPLQEDIIRDSLEGRDAFVLMPTGGGKSLCFQLPALLRDGLTIVISPLISLMKDQVDTLQASGIPATFLNSTLGGDEARARLRGLYRGEFRLLYIAPERLMLTDFLEKAKGWRVQQIAIDEAHCISEWGHDFRPEYRQLSEVRAHFPEAPLIAMTATATDRVRADIVRQLKLKNAKCYVASFNRPNLTYRVVAKSDPLTQVTAFLREHPDDSGIIYCASRKTADSLAKKLSDAGFGTKPYHAGLEATERAATQEAFRRDDVRVVTATIAFGMGVNKPNVRFVIHYDLPKNLEGYYQETGRAGRDGLPAECVLLFSAGDVVKQKRFIEDKSEAEQVIAREQLKSMFSYAETNECRRLILLRYFNESFASADCTGCDNCLNPREAIDGTVLAQKFLSCVHRVASSAGFGFGSKHIIQILRGEENEAIERRGHDRLSTFGIGRDEAPETWQWVGRELQRLGLVEVASGKFATLTVTPQGMAALRSRTPVSLTAPFVTARAKPRGKGRAQAPRDRRIGEPRVRDRRIAELGGCDEKLFALLKTLRRSLADERNVPAYIIFSDAALREMAIAFPQTVEQFKDIAGVGEKKAKDFGEKFTTTIRAYLGK